ncbi:hypothetical protein DPMN_112512 [Dreissena polymorpha]|uniref:Uncharacterized protein n=1 Tax=Dreissena polymorpha TaxID=45954 RepID=A0A9D4KFS7_DREPO|nr:hypothetical protein DPMN_112512 [Dreissena polymorpha]
MVNEGNSEVHQLDGSVEVISNFPETQKDSNSSSSDDEPSLEADLEISGNAMNLVGDIHSKPAKHLM